MFVEYYGLREQPFGVTADPRFLYPSSVHLKATENLVGEIENALGFSALIAEPGLGKTTLLIALLETFRTALTAFVFETQCGTAGLLRQLLWELNVSSQDKDPIVLQERLQETLVTAARAGQKVIMIIDEAQNLQPAVLESIRLLSNFETRQGKLLHIVLSGQPQLEGLLNRPDLAQLRQRLWNVNWLKPLPLDEAAQYVTHRLRVAGHGGDGLFTDSALESVALRSGGIPREINRICFNALSIAQARREARISKEVTEQAAVKMGLRAAIQPITDAAYEKFPVFVRRALE